MSAAAALKKSLSETFAAQLQMPPALDQIAPETLRDAIVGQNSDQVVRVVDVRQPEEFSAGNVATSVNLPMDSFDANALAAQVAEDASSGKKPLVVFVSSQSPDIDANCALSFVRAWEEQGFETSTKLSGPSIAVTLLGGVVYWLQQYASDEKLTRDYKPDVWAAAVKPAAE
jgi:rhodanese-related sulfurtransferase